MNTDALLQAICTHSADALDKHGPMEDMHRAESRIRLRMALAQNCLARQPAMDESHPFGRRLAQVAGMCLRALIDMELDPGLPRKDEPSST